ncbi:ATP-binding protein [Sphingomonas morindae]|uniref:histidine kinase n=1 Tax=Sphingomonas morindae TaxID=1541170 RepID=A0ABY4X482_9SPHN|nr:ATP-binding protein [Sphingomonas morindae]USI71706.1 GHKL domain-containing protein [Sphingomonas morindae]
MAESRLPPPVPSRRARAARGALLALAAAASLWAAAHRIVLAPGMELYLGPIFYLAAYRLGGVRIGLVAAVLFMAPSLWWWGHGFPILFALGHVLFVWALRRRGLPLVHRTILYHLTIGWAASALFMTWHYHATTAVICLTILRKALIDMSGALLVDSLFLAFTFDRARLAFARRSVSLLRLIELSMLWLLTLAAVLVFTEDARQFIDGFVSQRTELEARAKAFARDHPPATPDVPILAAIATSKARQPILVVRSAQWPAALIRDRLGCTHLDDEPGTGPRRRNTFVYWFLACHVERTAGRAGPVWVATPLRALADLAYADLLLRLTAVALLLIAAMLLHLGVRIALTRSLRLWRETVEGLGRPDLTRPAGWTFQEFDAPIGQFVRANNAYVEMARERARLAAAAAELNAAVNLTLLSDIRYDPATRRLAFVEIDHQAGARARVLTVHAHDAAALAGATLGDEAMAELRIEGQGGWHLLIVREPCGRDGWRWGCLMRLRTPRVAETVMLHQARLIELSAMASALSHELRQPLFTIALAAENGVAQLDAIDDPATARVAAKFARIVEQVERARMIIERMSRYARVEESSEAVIDLAEIITRAAQFMRPLLVARDVRLVVEAVPGTALFFLPQVGIEQILVNAIQNAIDAIATQRERDPATEGVITLALAADGEDALLRIVDDGTGIEPAIAPDLFDAFHTTKPAGQGTGLGLFICRQIMRELGGAISLETRDFPARGCCLTLRFPGARRASAFGAYRKEVAA